MPKKKSLVGQIEEAGGKGSFIKRAVRMFIEAQRLPSGQRLFKKKKKKKKG
jgi:hypothetical protein